MSDTIVYGRPFRENDPTTGQVIGQSPYRYIQQGRYYTAQKQPCDELGRLLPMKPGAAATAAPPPPEDEPEDGEFIMPPSQEKPIDEDTPADEKPFDLLAWANGDPALAATPFQNIKAHIARVTGNTKIASKAQAIEAIKAMFGPQPTDADAA